MINDAKPSVNPLVDLVIVIDTSPSMKDEAEALSGAAEAAIAAAQASCPADVRVEWLGIEGTWRGTHFTRTIRDYLLQTCQIPETALRGRKHGEIEGGGAQEDGARAIEDVATHFDWRPGSQRAVFYLGDEALEGGGNQVESEDIEAANRAIAAAQAAGVTVHTYFGTTRSRYKEVLQQEYARVAHETRGQGFTAQDTLEGFTKVLEQAICTTRNRIDADRVHPTPPEQAEDRVDTAAGAPVPTIEIEHPSQPVGLTPEVQVSRRAQALDVVKNHVLAAFIIGTLPLPLIDMAALTALQLRMIARLSQLYHIPFASNMVKSILTSLLGGVLPATAPLWGRSFLKLIPLPGLTLGTIAATTTAGAMTYAVGNAFIQHFEQGKSVLTLQVEDIRKDVRSFLRRSQAGVSDVSNDQI